MPDTQMMSSDVPASPRFPVKVYQPDGGINMPGLIALTAAVGLVAVVLGYLVYLIAPHFYLVLIFPVFIGCIVGAIGGKLIRLTRLRNPMVGGVVGLFAGVLAFGMTHYFDYRDFKEQVAALSEEKREIGEMVLAFTPEQRRAFLPKATPEQIERFVAIFRVRNFMSFIDFMAHEGVSITRVASSTDKGISLGYGGTYIYWFIELLIVAGCSLGLMRSAACEPYCAKCGRWKDLKKLGTFTGTPGMVAEGLLEGDVDKLRWAKPSTGAGALRLEVSCCDKCAGHSPVELTLVSISHDKRGHEVKKKLARVTYPPQVIPPLFAMFHQPLPASFPGPPLPPIA